MEASHYARYVKQLALCAVLIFGGLLPAYIHFFPMNFFHRQYAIWSHQIDYASTPSEHDPEILILGDSRVQAAILPDRMGAPARSLAYGSATPADVWLVFERYLENHRPPRALLISFAPFHFLEPTSENIFWVRTASYKLWPIRDDLALIERARELGVPLVDDSVRHGAMAEWLLHRFNYPPYYLPALRNARIWGRRSGNLRAQAEIAASRGHTFYGLQEFSHGLTREVHYESFEASPLYEAYLRDILDRAATVGTEVRLALMPINSSSFAALDPNFVVPYEAWLSALAADYPAASIDTHVWSLPDEHFGDEHHLNRRGAQRVTDDFARALRESAAPTGSWARR